MKNISEEQVKELLSPSRAIEVVEKAFKDYAERSISMGNRGTLNVNNHGDACIFLPAVHRSQPYFSMKYAASFPSCAKKNMPTVQSVIWLFSSETGEACAMIHANELTALKTGAASAVATRYLSGKDARVLTIIGAGEQARTQISCISQVRDLKEIHLVDLDPSRCEALKEWVGSQIHPSIPVQIHSSADSAVPNADVIVTCTTSSRPVLSGSSVRAGTHINAIGSFTPDMQEIDEQTIEKSDKIVTDSIRETWQNAGDLIIPKNNGLISENLTITELGDIVSGKSKGRTSPHEITLYESVGFSPLDLAVAIEIYQKATLQ